MILGTITKPNKIITGAFSILFTLQRPIELKLEDIKLETLQGDPLGSDQDIFENNGSDYRLLFYLPDERLGETKISVDNPDIKIDPVIVQYDTVNRILPRFGELIKNPNKITLPIELDRTITVLKKRNIKVIPNMSYKIYGVDKNYQLVFSKKPNLVVIHGEVEKKNGLKCDIEPDIWRK